MGTLSELVEQVFRATPDFAARLDALKAQNPQVPWYPYTSMDKVNLLAMVLKTSAHLDVPLLGGRPRVLDVGAADGDLSFLFESVGCDVVTIDSASSNYNGCAGFRAMRELVGSNVELLDTDVDRGLDVTGPFDLILMLDVLYHLRNPLGALLGLCQMGRRMVITTRIFEVVADRVALEETACAYLLAPFEAAADDPTNYWIFTEAGFARALERSGWRIADQAHFGYAGHDSSPSARDRDKRVIALCERLEGYERLMEGHVLGRPGDEGAAAPAVGFGRPRSASSAGPAAEAEARCHALEAELAGTRTRLEESRRLLRERDHALRTIAASRSWRLTAPFRAAAGLVRRVKPGPPA